MTDFVLLVEGFRYAGWTNVSIRKSLGELAHSVSLQYTDRWTIDDDPWPIFVDQDCVLEFEGQTILTGDVTRVRSSISRDSWDLSAGCRSLTGRLIASSPVHKTGQWRNVTAQQILADICEPFSIPVNDLAGLTKKFRRFDLEDGETVFDVIDRVCRIRAVLPVTTNGGEIDLVRIDSAGPSVAIQPELAIDRDIVQDGQDRHSQYIFKGQLSATDEFASESAALQKGVVLDEDVGIYSPLVLTAETPADKKDLEDRAVWERNVRAARSTQASYTFDGVTDPEGVVWAPGRLVRVNDDKLKIDQTMVVNSVEMSVSVDEFQPKLVLLPTNAYSLQELPERGNAFNA